ncbi:MAG: hypothetical protein R2867_01790 [Caldilineaceae bacterium]
MDERPLIRASDIGLWSFCHRAWWLARVRNATHRAPERLAHGVAVHEAHGRTLHAAHRYRQWGNHLLAVAAFLSGLLLLLWLLQH